MLLTTPFLNHDNVAGIEPTTVHVNVALFSVLILINDGFKASRFKPVSSHKTGPVLSSAKKRKFQSAKRSGRQQV